MSASRQILVAVLLGMLVTACGAFSSSTPERPVSVLTCLRENGFDFDDTSSAESEEARAECID